MQSYWTNLAKTGDPNTGDVLAWSKFSEAADTRVNLSVAPSIVQSFRTEECWFWRAQYDLRFAAEGMLRWKRVSRSDLRSRDRRDCARRTGSSSVAWQTR